jgi:hypothetical protein
MGGFCHYRHLREKSVATPFIIGSYAGHFIEQ